MKNKIWKKTGNGVYDFYVDGQLTGSLNVRLRSNEPHARFTVLGETYTISLLGFWKTTVMITNAKGDEILTVKPEKWYGNRYLVSHNGVSRRLEIRNNPLAELALLEGETVLLAYGLDTLNGKASLRVTGDEATDYIYDFLLWYIFQPIATEQSGDEFVFNILLPAQ